nr:unnamed protein product [Naegleria fowleri]
MVRKRKEQKGDNSSLSRHDDEGQPSSSSERKTTTTPTTTNESSSSSLVRLEKEAVVSSSISFDSDLSSSTTTSSSELASTTSSPTTTTTTTATTTTTTTTTATKTTTSITKYHAGKEDHSLSAWLCRLYFISGLFLSWVCCCVIALPLYLLHVMFGFDKNRTLIGKLFRKSNQWVVESNPFWKVRTFYENRSTLDKLPKQQKKVIFVCNHQSNMDPFVLLSALPIEAKWVAKHVLFNVPFGGWLMRMAGDVPIVFKSKLAHNTVTDKDSVAQALSRLKNYLNNDTAVFFFPEGRRSDDPNTFLEYRKGAFIMSLECGADIIPLAVHGTHTMWETRHKMPKPGRASIVIGDPISVKGMTLEKDVDHLLEKVRNKITALHVTAKHHYINMK